MAFSYGFFNAKNLDRTYTAENFCDYLGSIICNGIQDNYGGCFKPTASKLKLAIASGKAWIDGHYFISDTAYTFDLSGYVDESLPRYVSIGICCNKDENYRSIEFELLVGTPATKPTIPEFTDTDTKTYLTLFAVKIEAGANSITVTDYRENDSYCGYVRCILGKCRVTDMLSQLDEIISQMKSYNTDVVALTNKVEELTAKVDEMTGDVISVGSCGNNINYVLFSDGKLILKGTGEMYNCDDSDNKSLFYDNSAIKSVIISEGITDIGEFAFYFCNNLTEVTLPSTLAAVKRYAFMPHTDLYVPHRILYGLTSLSIPNKVTELAQYAFAATSIPTLNVPSSVVTVGSHVFAECQKLTTVRYGGSIITDRMFLRCLKLKNFTITKSCKDIQEGCFNYCEVLTEINYEGSIAEWNSVNKRSGWDNTIDGHILKIHCLDGYLEWDETSKTWNEVNNT